MGPTRCPEESRMPKTIVITGTATGMGRATVPAVTKDVIYRAVIDGPHGRAVLLGPWLSVHPRGKRILGADGYWQEFRSAVLGHPSDLWTTLMEAPGTTP